MRFRTCSCLLLASVVAACSESGGLADGESAGGGSVSDSSDGGRSERDSAAADRSSEDAGDRERPEDDAPPPPRARDLARDAGSRTPADAGEWCWDDDGIPDEVERAAGLDPCKNDSDEDGCSDRYELHLGGCDDARRTLVPPDCFGDGKTVVRFTAPALAAGSWPVLELRSQADAPFLIRALSSSEGSYGTGARFVEVPVGDVLTFDFDVRQLPDEPARFELMLVDEDGNKVDEGQVILMAHDCVIVI